MPKDAAQSNTCDVEQELRWEWFVNHGCPTVALYGDDGEMQCHACPADFKRMPLDDLRTLVTIRRAQEASRVD